MNRTEKEEAVASLHKTFEDASLVVVAHYTGLTVAEMSLLRGRMRKAGAAFKVTKNRLTRRALEGTKYKPLEGMFTGPTAIAYSKDPVAAAKAAIDFAKTNEKLVVVGGAAGQFALVARASRNDRRHDPDSGDENRRHPAGAGRANRPRVERPREVRRSRVKSVFQ